VNQRLIDVEQHDDRLRDHSSGDDVRGGRWSTRFVTPPAPAAPWLSLPRPGAAGGSSGEESSNL